MPRKSNPSVTSPDPRLNRALWQWLTLGMLAVALLPAARGSTLWLGWLPFWAVLAPLAALAVLHRQVLMTAWRTVLVRAPRRRRQRGANRQARRAGFRSSARQPSQYAA